MAIITGILENGKFIPDKPISIPNKQKVTLTIEENQVESPNTFKNKRDRVFSQFCGLWTEDDLSEFNEAIKDLEAVDPYSCLINIS